MSSDNDNIISPIATPVSINDDNENKPMLSNNKNFLQIPFNNNPNKNIFRSPISSIKGQTLRRFDSNNSVDEMSQIEKSEMDINGTPSIIKDISRGSFATKEGNNTPKHDPASIEERNGSNLAVPSFTGSSKPSRSRRKSKFADENTLKSFSKHSIFEGRRKSAMINGIKGLKIPDKDKDKDKSINNLSKTQNKTGGEIRGDFDIVKKMKIKALKKIIVPIELSQVDSEFQRQKETPLNERIKFIKMMRMPELEYIRKYNDPYPLLRLRKRIWRFMTIFSNMCGKIIRSSLFENLTLIVIIWNTIMLALYDPLTDTSAYPDYFDTIFLAYYTTEMFLKIFGLGLILADDAYLRDPWNVMDCIIVITAYIPILFGGGGVNLRGLRSLRVLRPLRTISTVKSLRVIVSTVLQTLPYMRDIIFIALFSFFVYAIVGLQLFMGSTKNRCMDINTGIPIYSPEYPEINYQFYCGAWSCTGDLGLPGMKLACAKMIAEPYYGVTSFGTILWSLLNVYQTVTQEGWSTTMFILQMTWNPLAAIYCISCTFIGAYYFMNLVMAVITTIFELNAKQDGEELKRKRKATHEETLMQLVNNHKVKIIELIEQYKRGEIKYSKIQFIRGKLYFYDPKNPKLKKPITDITKNYWNKFLVQVIGDKMTKDFKKKQPALTAIIQDAKLATGSFSSVPSRYPFQLNRASNQISSESARNLTDENGNVITIGNDNHQQSSPYRRLENSPNKNSLKHLSKLNSIKSHNDHSYNKSVSRNFNNENNQSNMDDSEDENKGGSEVNNPKSKFRNSKSQATSNIEKSEKFPSIASLNSHQDLNTTQKPSQFSRQNSNIGMKSGFKPKLIPISTMNSSGGPINNPSFQPYPVSDSNTPSKRIGNIKIKPLGIMMNPKRVQKIEFADIKEVDENEDSFIAQLQEAHKNPSVTNKIENPPSKPIGITNSKQIPNSKQEREIDENSSFLVSSDEMSTDEIPGSKAGLDDTDIIQRKKDKDKSIINASKSNLQKKNSKANVSIIEEHRKSKKLTFKGDESSIFKFRNHDASMIRQKSLSFRNTEMAEGTDKMADNINQDEETLGEYLNDDLENIEMGKDRFMIDIRYLKIDVTSEDVTTKIDSLDEVAPLYRDVDRQRKEEKEARKRLKIKLYPIYRIGEIDKDKLKAQLNKIRMKYDIPMHYDPKRANIYDRILKKLKKAKDKIGNNTVFPVEIIQQESRLQSRKTSMYITQESSLGTRLQSKKTSSMMMSFKTVKSTRRLVGQGEADIDLIYSIIKNRIDDDTQIEIKEIIDVPINEHFNFDKEYKALKQEDVVNKSLRLRNWSGHEILSLSYFIARMNKIKNGIMENYESIWEPGYLGLIQSIRRRIFKFCDGDLFSNFLLLVVLVNTVFLASPGLMPEDDATNSSIKKVNQVFTYIFISEMGLKLIGMGPIDYIRDAMNILDGGVVMISIVELIFEANAGAFKAFRAIRIFRATRVLRVTKLLRALAFMRFLIGVLSKTVKDFMSVLLLMSIFLYIYALLGMQLLGGQFNYQDNVGWSRIRNNFDTLPQALISAYQIMTIENWNNILFFAERSAAGYYLPLLYLISWIIIGNYILLNLLMAMLLAQFGSDDADEDPEGLEELEEEVDAGDEEGDNIETKETVQPPKFHFTMTHPKLTNNPPITNQNAGNKNEAARTSTTSLLMDDEDGENIKTMIWYEGNYCEKSLFIFYKKWFIRKGTYWLIKQPWFDYIVLLIIIISSLKLAFDTYIDSNDPSMANIVTFSENLDLGLNFFFFAEATCKVIALGFILDDGSYLRDSWNVLDFVIVLSGLIDLASTSVNLPFLKILRLLRTLRPLRLVTHNKSMRLIVTALLASVGGIFNVGIVVLMIILIFAILGVNLLRGKLGVCNVSSNPNLSIYGINYDTCAWLGYEWLIWDINWENVFNGMLSLFVVTTQEGWPDYMFRCTDANDTDVGPVASNYLIIFTYFAVFLLIGAYFLVNLFVGVIMYEYSKAEKDEKKKYSYLTDEQEKWIELQKMILATKPDVLVNPTNKFQKFWYYIVDMNIFEVIIMLCILANMVTMGLNYDESLPAYNHQLKTINYVFTAIFIFEMLAKLSAYGIKIYFMNNWNQFDFFVVATSIIDIIFDNLQGASLAALRVAPQMGRVFRILRVTRLIRLIKQFPSIQKLISTLVYSLPSMINVFTLVLLAFFMYSVLATFLFSDIISGQTIGLYVNFSNFTNSIVTLFRCSTGENWYVIMFDTIHPTGCIQGGTSCGPGSAVCVMFWITFILFIQYIVLNLFVMVILNLFSDFMMNEDNPLHHFSENIGNFKKVWNEFSKKNNGLFIHQKHIINFFLNLQEPLGYKKEDELGYGREDTKKIASQIMKMNIRMDNNNQISFHEILFAAFKKAYGPVMEGKKEGRDLVRRVEEKTLGRIDALNKSLTLKKAFTIGSSRQKKAVINPLFQLLFVGMSFRGWLKYSAKMLQYQVEHGDTKDYVTSSEEVESSDSFADEDEEDSQNDENNNEENLDDNDSNDNEHDDDQGRPLNEQILDTENIKSQNASAKKQDSKNINIQNELNIDEYENEGMIMRSTTKRKTKGNDIFSSKAMSRDFRDEFGSNNETSNKIKVDQSNKLNESDVSSQSKDGLLSPR